MPLIPVTEPARQVAGLRQQAQIPATPTLGTAPAALAGLARLDTSLARRNSVRVFAAREVGAAALVAAIDDGYTVERELWPASRHGNAGLLALVAAFDVAGWATGLHRVLPGSGGRGEYLGPQEWLPTLRQEYPAAPAVVLICGNIHPEAEPGGGYRASLTRAGGLGYAVWLSAVAAGMAGSVFGGTMRPVTAAAHHLDDRLRHLFTVAIGYGQDD